MMTETTDVCVVGGGPTGIFAVKYCLEYGLSVVCFDDRSKLGGLWVGSDPSVSTVNGDGSVLTSTHDALYLNTSQYVTTCSDFPLPADLTGTRSCEERYLDGPQLLDYLNRYARAFGVMQFVRQSSEVMQVRRSGDEATPWEVTVKTKRGDSVVFTKSLHRYVIVASGFYRKPHIPKIAGMDDSPVQVIHSGHCRFTGSLFAGKRVLVVGGSISAGDMVQAALMRGAEKVTWALTRDARARSVMMIQRYPFTARFAWDEWITYFSVRFVPACFRLPILQQMSVFAHRRAPDAPIDMLNDRITVQDTDLLKEATDSGHLDLVPATIAHLEEGRLAATLTDGRSVATDVCVMGTGYEPSYSFLADEVTGGEGLSALNLYRFTVATNASAWGISFLYTTSFAGSGFAVSEMEARWLIHEISHQRLASEESRQCLLQQQSEIYRPFHTPCRRNSMDYMVDIARRLGCLPRLWPLLFSPFPHQRRVALGAVVGPLIPQLFRLRGPYAKPEMAGPSIVAVSKELWGWKFHAMALVTDFLHLGLWAAAAAVLYRRLA